MKLSIIIPVYNEEKTIIKILNKIKNINLGKKIFKEIIVIDDCSNDNTYKILKENKSLYDKLFSNPKNMGKGYCVKKGLINASGDYVIFQDADDEYDPEEYKKFIKIYEKFNPDLIIGSRINYDLYTSSGNYLNKIGNNLITMIFNFLFNTTFTDIYSCYIFFKKEKLDAEKLRTNGFEQQAEILTSIIKKCKKKYEIKINYNGRTKEEGKKIRYYHIFFVIYEIIRGYLLK